jgi:uncharacterized protein (TIGR03435 family)
MRLMVRSLLEDRFQLKAHNEARRKRAFGLVLASAGRMGPQLRPHTSDDDCAGSSVGLTQPSSKPGLQLPPIACGAIGVVAASAPDRARLVGRKVTIDRIAGLLKNPVTGVDRPVVDRTGLSGTFDFSLEWYPDRSTNGPRDPITTALDFLRALRSQLGLKLVATTAQVDTLLIDRIQHPDEN